jgi:aerobic carbon-monoxide dehydrogenase medium subunit
VKPAQFNYFDPKSIDETLVLLREWGDEGKVLAGGQTLGPMLNFRALAPAALIDINRVADLAYHRYTDAGTLIGALTRNQVLEDDDAFAVHQPLAAAAIPLIAHRAIRNRGTIGGSLAHADPAAEWGAVIITLDAELMVRRHGTPNRAIPAADFFQGLLETALAPDELLVEIRLPPWPRKAGWSIIEFSRRHGDFALAGIATMIMLAADGTCSDIRISAFGLGPTAMRLTEAESALRGSRPSPQIIHQVSSHAAAEISPMDDNHASAGYRRQIAEVLVDRSITEAAVRAVHN